MAVNNIPILITDDEGLDVSQVYEHDLHEINAIENPDPQESRKKNPRQTLLPVDTTAAKPAKKTKTVRKKRSSSKKDTAEALPFWVRSPKEVKDIPAHIKLVCDRLLHVESQIKKFSEERQGLLSTLWKFGAKECKSMFPDPVLETLDRNGDKKAEEEKPEAQKKLSQLSEIDEKLDYNNLDDKLGEDGRDLWKSTWLSSDSEETRTRTPSIKRLVSVTTSSSSSRDLAKYSMGSGSQTSRSNKDADIFTPDPEEITRESIQFFKSLDFCTFSCTDMNTWRKFFGLKKMPESELVKELGRIRDYLVSFVEF